MVDGSSALVIVESKNFRSTWILISFEFPFHLRARVAIAIWNNLQLTFDFSEIPWNFPIIRSKALEKNLLFILIGFGVIYKQVFDAGIVSFVFSLVNYRIRSEPCMVCVHRPHALAHFNI